MLIFSLVLIQLLVFGGLILILRKILTQNVVKATKHIEEMSQDYAEKEKQLNLQTQEVQRQSEEMLKKAQEESLRTRQQILKDAEEERDRLLQQTHTQSEELIQQADKSRQALLGEVNERIAKEAVTKACELIQDTLPEQFKREVHQHWIEDLLHNGFSQLERLRIPPEMREAKISSAFALNDEQCKNLIQKLNAVLNREVSLRVEVDPKLVAGFIVSIGSLVLDGSLKHKIQERARNA